MTLWSFVQWCSPWPWCLASRLPWGTLLPCPVLANFQMPCLALEKNALKKLFDHAKKCIDCIISCLDAALYCLAFNFFFEMPCLEKECLGFEKMPWLHHWFRLSEVLKLDDLTDIDSVTARLMKHKAKQRESIVNPDVIGASSVYYTSIYTLIYRIHQAKQIPSIWNDLECL